MRFFWIPVAAIAAFHPVMAATAQGTETELREAPVIVTLAGQPRTSDELVSHVAVLDRADLVADMSATLGDTLDKQPGVASSFFGQGASRPVLRGLGAERVQVLTNGVGVIDASAASPDHQVSADGIDAEKVEILRGPAALLYGGQAIGGVVNVIDGLIAETVPERPASGNAYIAYGSVNDGTEGGVRGQFVLGPAVVTLSASARDFGDYDIPGFAASDRQRANGGSNARGSVSNSFVETGTLSSGISLIGERGFVGVAARQQTSTYGLPGDEETPFIDLEQSRYDVRGAYSLDAYGLKRVSGAIAIADYGHTEFEAPGVPGTVYTSDGVEGRFEVSHEFAGLDGVAGLQASTASLGAFGDEAFITPTDTKNLGVFLYESHDFDGGLGIEGGLRADSVEHDNQQAGKVDFNFISASFGAHTHLDNGVFLGVQLSRAQRAPNPSELFADGPHLATRQYEIGDAGLDVETGTNLEGTVRWQGDTVKLGASVFATGFDNFIALEPRGDVLDDLPVYVFVQQDADFVGAELTAEVMPEARFAGGHWHYTAGLDLVRAEFEDGAAVPFVPPVTLNAGVLAHWDAISLGVDVSAAADQDRPGAGQFPTDGFTLIDLSATYDLSTRGIGREGTEVFVQVRNATDQEARVATSVLKDLLPMPGRNVRLGLRATF